MKHSRREDTRTATELTCEAPSADSVFIAGTFNNWSSTATPMIRQSNGRWVASIQLPPGHYEYKFVVDGNWCCSPGCEDGPHAGCHTCVPNAFGTMNRILEVRSSERGLLREVTSAELGAR